MFVLKGLYSLFYIVKLCISCESEFIKFVYNTYFLNLCLAISFDSIYGWRIA